MGPAGPGVVTMSSERADNYRWFLEDGVAVVEVIDRELNQPEQVHDLGLQLRALLAQKPADKMLLNFDATRDMGSTAFAVLFEFVKAASEAGVKLLICGMHPDIRIGADILSLGEFIPIVDDEPAAMAALRASRPT